MPSKRIAPALLTVAAVALAGCDHSVQTTSGADYLAGYSESGLVEETAIDLRVREVAAIEPNLTFPARIGLARIDQGGLSPVPAAEAEAWAEAVERLGPSFGTFVPVNRLVAELISPTGSDGDRVVSLRRLVEKIRLGAARQHLDAVLIYQTHASVDAERNVLAIADWTIIGAFMLPGQSIEATAFASAILIDVRNGYPYGMADTVVAAATLATTIGSQSAGNRLSEEARTAAALLLIDEVEQMMLDLRLELDVADAAEDEAWR